MPARQIALEDSAAAKALRGVAVSPGYANGTLVAYRAPSFEHVARKPIGPADVEREFRRFSAALADAREEVVVAREQVAADIGEAEATIFDAHIELLGDPALKENVRTRLARDLVCAEAALADELTSFADLLGASSSDYTRERAMDAHDVGKRVLRHLCQNGGQKPLASLPADSIIVARDLMPSDTITMDRRNVSGIATERGGPTSHAGILARSLGIPAVTGLGGLLDSVTPGDTALLDGVKGTLLLAPTEVQKRRFTVRRRLFEQALGMMRLAESKTCRLRDDTRVNVRGNISRVEEVDRAVEHNLDGIGLFRTELMYLQARTPPTLAQQCRDYARVAEAFDQHPVTVRTFDFSPDKHPAFLSPDVDAIDVDGLEFSLRHMRLFKTQVRAVVRAARKYPNLRILFPMVTGWRSLDDAVQLVKAISAEEKLGRDVPIGAMVETPAAVFSLPEIIKRVDFLSIGCNDLAQYVLALGRNTTEHETRHYGLHPALLRAIQQVTEEAATRNCPVCLCGEAASDPITAAVFVGLGVRELSVSPVRAPEVRYALSHLTLKAAKRLAGHAMKDDPELVVQEARELLPALRKIEDG